MPQLVEPANLPPAPFNGSTAVFSNTTIRQTLQVSLAAQEIRIRLSNVFGANDLKISKVTIGLPENPQVGTSALQTETLKTVSFNGSPDIGIPNGGLVASDPIKFPVKAQSVLMINIYLEEGQQGFSITGHPGSRTSSYLAFGDWTGAKNLTDSPVKSTDHWYFISGVEALLPSKSSAFVIIGDSITDGRGSTTNGNNRWPDLLLARMQKHRPTSNIAILNQAAGGNRILQDGLGPNVISRLDRDVLAQSGVRYAMIFEGVNDIGVAASDTATQAEIEKKLVAAYTQIATRVHALGIPVFGATIPPFGSSPTSDYEQPYSSVEREKTRQQINKFIRQSGVFDAVLDFDRALRDPHAPSQLLEKYDSGDHLHPNVAGYQALADYFPLGVFE
ncbi:Esterase SGNH hydrolase-type subgroup [Penicillium cf. griseofulvum]|uniref:Esterase SGNH hydrolase-type subgroup n=1 Tax=Penicillium cf. griseofulvum TaxID=2972120 RepID=A0A9W9MU73_9EURO|nr:Esterase SGNH hydrolase-type subgroup [Penicillium cf. griseofulvum]KAJ5445802.1 Esterase SGNH hydrolase-type subgroup [Penicillium cf. griseofulvum]KAJ5447524.1 Esterase SGNH hydrolase-type subgroup [Penicillium cf. griseofulvum]